MGMDLEPINPSPDAPRDNEGRVVENHYTWGSWRELITQLNAWGVDTSEFSGMNDGDIISEATCKKVADALEQHLPEIEAELRTSYDDKLKEAVEFSEHLPEGFKKACMPLKPDAELAVYKEEILIWRNCGGCRQY